jgi:hypothetical protein
MNYLLQYNPLLKLSLGTQKKRVRPPKPMPKSGIPTCGYTVHHIELLLPHRLPASRTQSWSLPPRSSPRRCQSHLRWSGDPRAKANCSSSLLVIGTSKADHPNPCHYC